MTELFKSDSLQRPPHPKQLLGHKDIATKMRYAHLLPAHQLDAVPRLNRNPTDTSAEESDASVAMGAEVVELVRENSAPGVIRTPDPLVRSPSEDDPVGATHAVQPTVF